MPLILASQVSKSFKKNLAVDDISLSVNAGEIYGMVGPDGAGKTTFIRLLCGAMLADHGEIAVTGFDIRSQVEQARANIGYLPQRFSLYEDLTVLENIRFLAEVRGLPASQWFPRCMEILKFVGLADFTNRRAGHLSGGMKQKLGLAAALVHRPQLLLLDEPTTGVDPVTRQDFWQLIIKLVSEDQVAVLVSTPYMDEAARCHRVGFIHHGKLLVEGTPIALRSHLDGRILELQGEPLPLLRRIAKSDPNVEDAQMFGDRLHLRIHQDASEATITSLKTIIAAQGGTITRLRLIPPSLEDLFISLLETAK